MSVYKIDSSLPTTTKISSLSDMTVEIDGKVSKGQFNKNELTTIYSDLGLDRKYLRDQSLGHTLTTYTGWTHIHAESGYSIWKFSPTSYKYNLLNELYLDSKLLENRLQADAETATAFDNVFLYNGDSGSSYINNTTEAGTENGTSFELMDSTNDYLYVGLSTTFRGISFEFEDRGSGYTIYCEYYNGSTWTDLNISATSFGDDTSNFESDGRIYFEIPSNWTVYTVNSINKYWIRISTTTEPTTVAKAFLIVPANSVPNLLKLSSSEILKEEWAWCSYGTAIYVTIRNSGQSAYEGNYYITSSTSSINKQNYFIHNHEFTANYEDSTYISNSISLDSLSDVAVTSGLTNGQTLIYDSADALWRSSSILTVLPTGYVGVNTSSPLTVLDVNGVLSVRNNQFAYMQAGEYLDTLTSPVLLLGWVSPATTETDLSGAGHNATYVNYLTTDQINVGLSWTLSPNGTTKYLTIADHDDFSFTGGQHFSFGKWIYVDSNGGQQDLITKYDATTGAEAREWRLYLNSTPVLVFKAYDESADAEPYAYTTNTISDGWHLLVMTYDDAGGTGATFANGLTFYVDGLAVAKTAANDGSFVDMENTASAVLIGCEEDGSGTMQNFMANDYGQIFIAREALTAAQIWKLYIQTRGYYAR